MHGGRDRHIALSIAQFLSTIHIPLTASPTLNMNLWIPCRHLRKLHRDALVISAPTVYIVVDVVTVIFSRALMLFLLIFNIESYLRVCRAVLSCSVEGCE